MDLHVLECLDMFLPRDLSRLIGAYTPFAGVCSKILQNKRHVLSILAFDNTLVTGCSNGIIYVCNLSYTVESDLTEIHELSSCVDVKRLYEHTDCVEALIMLPDGRLVSGSRDQSIRIWDLTYNLFEVVGYHDGGVVSLAVLSDGRLVSASYDKTIRVWDLTYMVFDHISAFLAERDVVIAPNHVIATAVTPGALAVLPDGRLAFTDNSKITIMDVTTGAKQDLTGHTSRVTVITMLLDGRLASASRDNTIRVWDLTNGTYHILEGHTNVVYTLAVLTDGRLVSGSADTTVRVWDVNTGKSQVLEGHTKHISALSVLSDGRLASASLDGIIRVWE